MGVIGRKILFTQIPQHGRFSIFDRPRAQAISSKEATSSKLKNRPARRLPRHFYWGLVFRSAAAQKVNCAPQHPITPKPITPASRFRRALWRKQSLLVNSQQPGLYENFSGLSAEIL